jgi:hypothetical protein
MRYNPPPGWPPPPPGFSPGPGWEPDPSWPPPPPGWPLWVDDDAAPARHRAGPARGDTSQRGDTSRWAIASLILGILAVIPLSVIFAFLGLSRIRRSGQRGRGLAVAGLVLSAIWLVVIIAASVLGGGATPSAGGKITHRGSLNVFALTTGDCFDNPATTSDIQDVTAIPCGQAHDAQVFAKFSLSGSDSRYPAQATLNRRADDGCNSRTGSIDKSAVTGAMTIHVLFPEQDAWAGGQRTVSCLIVTPKPTLKSSLLNS